MSEFDDINSEDTSLEYEAKDYQGDNPSEDMNVKIREELESMQELEEDSDTDEEQSQSELSDQSVEDEAYAEDIEHSSPEDVSFENMSDDELREKYEGVRAHDAALGDQYARYDEQIGQLSSNKPYYPEKEWNSYMDEKIKAQDEVSARRYQIQSEMRALEKEIDRRKT